MKSEIVHEKVCRKCGEMFETFYPLAHYCPVCRAFPKGGEKNNEETKPNRGIIARLVQFWLAVVSKPQSAATEQQQSAGSTGKKPRLSNNEGRRVAEVNHKS